MTFMLIMAEVHRLIPYIGIAVAVLILTVPSVLIGIGVGTRRERRRIKDHMPDMAHEHLDAAEREVKRLKAELRTERELSERLASANRAARLCLDTPEALERVELRRAV